MQWITLKFALAFNVLLACGCGPAANYAVLECEWKEEVDGETVTKSSVYCFNANGTVCKGGEPSAQEWCAWNQFHSQDPADISKFSNPDGFAEITWQAGSCLGDGGYQESKLYPPDPNKPDDTCRDQSSGSGGGSGASSADPATSGGDPTTTAGTTDTTGGADDTVYFCSMQSPWKCADLDPDSALMDLTAYPDPYTDPNKALHTKWDACWSAVEQDESLYLSKCVDAPSDFAARVGCQQWCDQWRIAMEDACGKDVDCNVVTTIDCALDGTYVNNLGLQVLDDEEGEQPVKKSLLPNYACDGEPMKVGEGSFVQFEASAALITPQGVSAGIGSFRGFLGYNLSECTPGNCTITIDTLVGLTDAVEGGYSDAGGMGGMFEIHGMGFQATAPISGLWQRHPGRVIFPHEVMKTQFWAREVLIDGVPATSGYGAYNADIDRIVGTLAAEDGPLSLSLVLDMPYYGLVSVSLHTLPPN